MRFSGLALLLAGAGTLVGMSLWTSAVLILRPHPPPWLARVWPGGLRSWQELPAQTLAEIDAELAAQQQSRGRSLVLSAKGDRRVAAELTLIPIFETRPSCTRNCEAIVELRLYRRQRSQPTSAPLQLLDQLEVRGPTEADVLKSLAQTAADNLGSTYELPLNALKSLQEPGLPGSWLTLTGRWQGQGSPLLYGQIVYVNPQTREITSLLNWQSPPGRLPTWHNVDQAGLPELLVNQSYGLEPRFQLFRVANIQAVGANTRLQEISLIPLSIQEKNQAIAYQNALFLAQRGLWSDAQTRLYELKSQLGAEWTPNLEQQLQLVALHSRFSATQAEREWSQPSQKLLALLLDGQWQTALGHVMTEQTRFSQAVLPLLKRDSSRVWPRLTATLELNPNQKEARFWNALLLMAKEDKAAALKWLTADETSPLRKEFETITTNVLPPKPAPAVTATASTSDPANESTAAPPPQSSPPWQGIVGRAATLTSLDASQWQRPAAAPPPSLALGQQWYVVTLSAGWRQSQWQRPLPALKSSSPPTQLWQSLGLGPAAILQGLDQASGRLHTLEILGTQQQGQSITLLARGGADLTPLLVVTPGLWRDLAAVESMALADFLPTQPEIGDRLLSTVYEHMGLSPESLRTNLQQPAAVASPWASLQRVDWLNNGSHDFLLTLSPELMGSQGLSASSYPAQLILTAQGELLYSNLWSSTEQQLRGWLQAASGPAALVVVQGNEPNLLTWSPQSRRFQ